jgi:AAA15 family ATPase/GTPase
MKILKIELENFKRFANLHIDNIPNDAKLVLLIGSNGSGKSCVFDAFDYLVKGIYKGLAFNNQEQNDEYYYKDKNLPAKINITLDNKEEILKENNILKKNNELAKKFIGRSSIRIVPHITNNANPDQIAIDMDSPRAYIEPDQRFINDVFEYIQRINNALREPVFQGKTADTLKIFNDFIQPLNSSLQKIFGDNSNTSIRIAEFKDASPHSPAKLIFQKGKSKINYDLLSHGEKQVIILLLNFIVRKEYYEDKIIFIDEMDCHLNTLLQEKLLAEIVEKWIPDSSQLWTASHALGFISYANKSKQAAIIDFDLFDFDTKQVLFPSAKENIELFQIAVPKSTLSEIMRNKQIVFCENKNDKYYNLLAIPDCIFTGVKDSRDVFLNIKNQKNYSSIRDRDFLSDSEILKINKVYPNHHILRYYSFESYLYHPDNIEEAYPDKFDKNAYIEEITKQKNERYKYILTSIEKAKKTYEEFKTNPDFEDKNTDGIVDDFASNEFEKFYKYYDMKNHNKTFFAAQNYNKERLVKTKWFKNKIEEILGIE